MSGFAHFQQQAKPQIGTPRGERLVDQTAVTIGTMVTYSLHRYLAAGVFAETSRCATTSCMAPRRSDCGSCCPTPRARTSRHPDLVTPVA